jgi:hypothetical protein
MGITWSSVEVHPRQENELEEAIPRLGVSSAYHIMSSIAEDEDNSELNESDYSEFEEGSSRSLSTIVHVIFFSTLT